VEVLQAELCFACKTTHDGEWPFRDNPKVVGSNPASATRKKRTEFSVRFFYYTNLLTSYIFSISGFGNIPWR